MNPLFYFCAFTSLLLTASPAQNLLTNGDLEAPVFAEGWVIASVNASAGLAPGSTTSAALPTTGASRIGQNLTGVTGDWQLDCYFAVKTTTNRAFSLLINQAGAANNTSAATVNIRCQSGALETFSSATGSWASLGLGTVLGSNDADADGDLDDPTDTKNVYRLRVTGTGWGTPSASYDIQLSEPNQTTFTRQAVGLSRYQTSSGTAGPPAAFLFNTAFGSNPGFWVDDVVFENIVLADDPNLGIPTPLPLFGTLDVDSGPVTKMITLQNSGINNTLNLTAASFTGPDAAFYTLNTTLPISLLPGETADLSVTLTPGAARRTFNATLNLVSNDPGNPAIPVALPAVVHAFGEALITDGTFDSAPFPTPWITTGTLTPSGGLRAPSVTAATLSGPGTGGVNSTAGLAVTAPSDWILEFDLLVPSITGRSFQMFVHSFGEPNRLDGAPLNIRVENGLVGVLNGAAWQDLTELSLQPSIDENMDGDYEDPADTKMVYRVQLTGRGWATASASYDISLTEANGATFTRSARRLTSYVTGQGNARTARPTAFLFSTAAGNNSGFTVDSVTFKAGAPPALPIYVPVTVEQNGNTLTLLWDAPFNTTYKVWASSDLINWTEAEAGIPGPTYEEQLVIPGKRFYRVELE